MSKIKDFLIGMEREGFTLEEIQKALEKRKTEDPTFNWEYLDTHCEWNSATHYFKENKQNIKRYQENLIKLNYCFCGGDYDFYTSTTGDNNEFDIIWRRKRC